LPTLVVRSVPKVYFVVEQGADPLGPNRSPVQEEMNGVFVGDDFYYSSRGRSLPVKFDILVLFCLGANPKAPVPAEGIFHPFDFVDEAPGIRLCICNSEELVG